MTHFSPIKEALQYIDEHLGEALNFESLAARFHFSPYYFHRIFSAIVGKTIAAHIRDRRLLYACAQLMSTEHSVLDIGLDCGYDSAQSFSRAFKTAFGLPPAIYRKQGIAPVITTVDEMIMKFTNRLRGGIDVNPSIIRRDALLIAGVSGDGYDTGAVWQAFSALAKEKQLTNKLSENGYEVRVYDGEKCTVHVGCAVSDTRVDSAYTLVSLPLSQYASFDVYVANGYDSENSAMDEWLQTNELGYAERLLDEMHYCVEYYDERFNGEEAGSIVEIWIPIEKRGV